MLERVLGMVGQELGDMLLGALQLLSSLLWRAEHAGTLDQDDCSLIVNSLQESIGRRAALNQRVEVLLGDIEVSLLAQDLEKFSCRFLAAVVTRCGEAGQQRSQQNPAETLFVHNSILFAAVIPGCPLGCSG